MGGGTGSKGLILVDTAKMTGRNLAIDGPSGWVEFDPKSDNPGVLTPRGIIFLDREGAEHGRCPTGGSDVQRVVANPRGGEYLVWSGSQGPEVCRLVKK
jgi:hypothetical protein